MELGVMATSAFDTTETKRVFHQPRPESGFMSRRQVAEEFGFSVGYLNLLPSTELPFYKRGGKVFYERATVIAWIKGEKVAPPAPDTPKAKPSAKRGRKPKPVIRGGR